MDADPEWYPGKADGAKRGPKPLLTPQKRARIAASAMSQKAAGEEPDPTVTVHRCPTATLNPRTQKPFCDKSIRKVFLEDCYDFVPEHPWKFQAPLQNNFLPEDVKAHRLSMASDILERVPHGDDGAWWYRHVVWFDPCASILPRSRRQYDKMRRAALGNRKRLISDDAREYSRNLRAPKEVLKQKSWEAERISWIMVMSRGVVAVHMLPADWATDGEGLAAAATELPRILRRMLGNEAHLPRVLFTDRGTGMYTPRGRAVRAWAEATSRAKFRLYWGTDAKQQSPDMGDLLLHETAVSWFRARMKKAKPVTLPWEETRAQWEARAQRCVQSINAECNAHGLCHDFPARLRDCLGRGGDRLRK